MKKYMLEETYEAIQAIEDKDSKEMCEEFGDVCTFRPVDRDYGVHVVHRTVQ